ncbi:hypothetical protein B2D45_11785 [Lactobacillus hilgardii]|uniref:Uncharacterized protein n=1 Tax=Lentilactobacillus hilgardii (strain ATCC 8290 / DSM 20176 / CCUG 30140 / JCM 1155 / KCTC 3500 / NBRC 15886 / NCIMB 8040 / NRRL B-1843 / 9) TaxID=1423757 RepID=C0XIM6_LENH9|nr:hypothetical protein HMPREF0497_0294 [Lentilactobacillus buchneri ATCC 11577]EEI24796.1 hypothetical protein HMPREF0519_1087 [Lentilactobacillus hilgardii DSM 20176 = ATCC 8290]MCT3395175.1 hypothetical protein [Lentilactobacillus hilgardii]QEU37491.1 hypothetical protein LH500_00170 [Lentilactobacillus hilgardii]
MFGFQNTDIIGFAKWICERVLSTIMWTTKRVLDIFKKNAVVEENGLSYQPVDNYVDNLFISLFFYTG